MKFKLIFFFIFVVSCAQNYQVKVSKKAFNSKGFAYIYNEVDFEKKIIKKKLNNESLQISHNILPVGSLIRVINPKNNKSVVLKNEKRNFYPDFYKILITKPVADELILDYAKPFVEVLEVKKNKSFVAKKTKIFKEEEKIHSNAPVETVKIANISKNKKKSKKKVIKENFYIIIGEFYSRSSALLLKERITNELTGFNSKKLFIKSKKTNKITLLSGPYKSINFMKNDYIQLKNFGFEELNIGINE